MRAGWFLVTPELLRHAFQLPVGADIIGAGWENGHVRFLVEHPDLKDSEVGDLPTIKPMWKRQADVVFLGWGQE